MKEIPFEQLERAIYEIEKNWRNVFFKFVSKHEYNLKDTMSHKELLSECTVKNLGMITVNIPSDFNMATTIVACLTEKGFIDLDKELQIFEYNLSHPDINISFPTWLYFQKYSK